MHDLVLKRHRSSLALVPIMLRQGLEELKIGVQINIL